jgi:hypothetical protein
MRSGFRYSSACEASRSGVRLQNVADLGIAELEFAKSHDGESMRGLATAAMCAILAGLVLARPSCAQESSPASEESPFAKLIFPLEKGASLEIGGSLRAFYSNDQRIVWSGVEETFGGEGALRSLFTAPAGDWTIRARSEFFLNEPTGGTLLRDPVRNLYSGDYTVPAFQVFQLALEAERGDWLIRVGKIRSFLGSNTVPMFTNSMMDAPFLQTEIIGFSETGVFVRWHPGPWSFDLGISNGEANLDTNSGKALIARVGIDQSRWSAGVWSKFQDGIGSEEQKRFNSFVGFDANARFGSWTFYGEGLIDEHGLYRDPKTINNPSEFSDFSLYGLDIFRGFDKPTYGAGFDAGAVYRYERLMVDWNYGIYFPEHIGVPTQDATIHRGLIKCSLDLTNRLQFYSVVIFENSRPQPFMLMNNYAPRALLFGFQFGF